VRTARNQFCLAGVSHSINVLSFTLTLLPVLAGLAHAQSYSIDWSKIGGGGTSKGGVYAVSGIIGQPDAGKMSGGNYAIAGGFWGIIAAVQTPGAPLMSIARTTTNTVVVSWSSPSIGFTLQQNRNGIAIANWSNVVGMPADNGTTITYVGNPSAGNRYYRLIKP
jgi:hypothetical protein